MLILKGNSMNLFTTSDNTKACVQALDDVLLGKTIIESAQMLSTAIHLNDKIVEKPEGIYKKYNANEEHNKWVRENQTNYKWTVHYLLDGLTEFHYRFGKPHDTWNVAKIVVQYENDFEQGEMTPFTRKFSKDTENFDELMSMTNTCQAYQQYLCTKWRTKTTQGKSPIWTKRGAPEFYKG